MVRVKELLPLRALHLLQCHFRIVVPTFVEPSSSTDRIGRPGELAHVVGKLPKSSLAFSKRRFGTFAFCNFLGNNIDAENAASGILQRVPVGKPDTLCVTAVRSLAADLYACDGLASAENRLHYLLDLIGNLRDRVSHGPSDVVRDGNPADLGQVPVDLQISAVRGEERESDRGGVVHKLQFGWLVGHFAYPVDWTSPHAPHG
jgi:hypothetical protein